VGPEDRGRRPRSDWWDSRRVAPKRWIDEEAGPSDEAIDEFIDTYGETLMYGLSATGPVGEVLSQAIRHGPEAVQQTWRQIRDDWRQAVNEYKYTMGQPTEAVTVHGRPTGAVQEVEAERLHEVMAEPPLERIGRGGRAPTEEEVAEGLQRVKEDIAALPGGGVIVVPWIAT